MTLTLFEYYFLLLFIACKWNLFSSVARCTLSRRRASTIVACCNACRN